MLASLPQRLYLWERRTLYLGPLHSPVRLSLAASRLLIGLQGNIRFRHRSQQRDAYSRSLLLPVGWQGTVDSARLWVADCHLDATGFEIVEITDINVRMQDGEPSPGHLVIAKKK